MIIVFLFILYLFIGELVLGGPGYWGVDFGISFRKLLFLSTVLIAYGCVFKIGKHLIVNTRDILIIFFMAISFSVWLLLLPVINGQSLQNSFQDGGSIFVFLLYLPIAQLMRHKLIDWYKIKQYFVVISTIVAIFQIGIWLIVFFVPSMGSTFSAAVKLFFNVDPVTGSIYVGTMGDGFYRVMWISTVYFVPAMFFILGNKSKTTADYFKLACFIFALFVSYTRAIWIGIVLGIFIAIILKGKAVLKSSMRTICLGLPIILVLSLVIGASIDPESTALLRLQSLTSEDGTDLRMIQINSIMDMWEQNFLVGIGFGGHAEYIRDPELPFNYEVSLISLFMKLGIVGIIFWFVIFALIFYSAKVYCKNIDDNRRWRYTLSGMIAFLFMTATNPYLLNFVGMSIILFLVLDMEEVCIRLKGGDNNETDNM